jgi:hypothetical protein
VAPEELIGRAVAVQRGALRTGLEGLASRLAGLAVSLSSPAAALGRRLSRGPGRGRRTRTVPAAGYAVRVTAPTDLIAEIPETEPASGLDPDLRVELELRRVPTTGGRYGLIPAGRGRYTLTAPSVLARIDLNSGTCRAELLPAPEIDGIALLLRALCILLTVEHGRGLALHASAAEREERAYLFCGPGGIGKSTALRRVVEAGARALADDLVLLRRVRGEWLAWPPTLERGPEGWEARPARGLPVAALLIPARGDGPLELESISGARWATLAPVFPPGVPLYERLLDGLGDLAERVPARRVVYADRRGALDGLLAALDEAE